MFDVDEGTTIIDTPGIKGFGLVDFKRRIRDVFFRNDGVVGSMQVS